MPNENISMTDIVDQLAHQSQRLNFLSKAIQSIKEDGVLAPAMEQEYLEIGFSDLLASIKDTTTGAAISLLEKELHKENEVYDRLIEEWRQKRNRTTITKL